MGQTTKRRGPRSTASFPSRAAERPLVQGEHAAYAVELEVLNVESCADGTSPDGRNSDDARTQVTVRIGRSEVIATRADPGCVSRTPSRT